MERFPSHWPRARASTLWRWMSLSRASGRWGRGERRGIRRLRLGSGSSAPTPNPCSSGDPDRHRREGFTLQELGRLAAQAGLRMAGAYTYRIPIPDRVMQVTPRTLSRSVATLGTRPLPLGLQLYAEFTKT